MGVLDPEVHISDMTKWVRIMDCFMSETASVRVPKRLHTRLKELADRKGESMTDVAESHLVVEGDDATLKLSDGGSSARTEAMRVLDHIVLGECEDPEHEEIREKLGVNAREEMMLAQAESVVGYCPRCGEEFVGEDVAEPYFGDTPFVEHQCVETVPVFEYNQDAVADLDDRPATDK